MPRDLLLGSVTETDPGLVSSPFLLTGGSTLYYAVEVAFSDNPGDATLTWVDITNYCRSFDFQRGRQHELNTVQAGTATLTLLNLDRRFEPAYNGSPYYPNVVPIKPIRVRMVLDGTDLYIQAKIDAGSSLTSLGSTLYSVIRLTGGVQDLYAYA